jgi:hypothetical protein
MIFNPTLILTLVLILNLSLYNRHSFSGSTLVLFVIFTSL